MNRGIITVSRGVLRRPLNMGVLVLNIQPGEILPPGIDYLQDVNGLDIDDVNSDNLRVIEASP